MKASGEVNDGSGHGTRPVGGDKGRRVGDFGQDGEPLTRADETVHVPYDIGGHRLD